jgi:Uma2 family endonuclease
MATARTNDLGKEPLAPWRPPAPLEGVLTAADLLERLGDIPANRVRLHPSPGTATEQDVTRILNRQNRPCELVEGTLVEKPLGYEESVMAALIITHMNNFVIPRKLGVVTGEHGTIKLFEGLIRIPDVAFTSWDTLPNRRVPKEPIPHLAPDLVIEVLSKGNTKREMERKVEEYFAAGVRLIWLVDPRKRVVTVYVSPRVSRVFSADQSLDGGDVLPGFSLSLCELFEG